MANKYDLGRPASSPFRGVSWNPNAGRYEARIAISKVHHFLGLFDDDISAAIVYDAWAVRLGVPNRSNGAAERFAKELPVSYAGEERSCTVCKGRGNIDALKLSNGEWIKEGEMPCPKCQNQNQSETSS